MQMPIPLDNILFFLNAATKNLEVQEYDALKLAVLGMSVVFCGLIILTLSLYLLEGSVNNVKKFFRWIFQKEEKKSDVKPAHKMTGEEAAAVCLSIVLYHRLHMGEYREKLTQKNKLRLLSPWSLSGKIHPTPPIPRKR